MNPEVVSSPFNWAVAWAFLSVVLGLAFAIALMLIWDFRSKQKLYRQFSSRLNELKQPESLVGEAIVVLSQKFDYLYSLPMFANEPLFRVLAQNRSMQEVLSIREWGRMMVFFKELDRHFSTISRSFIFSFSQDETTYWYEMHCSVKRISNEEFQYVCFIKNITKEVGFQRETQDLKESMSLLMSTSGDFLWSFDVEHREMKFLTPLRNENYAVIPRTKGVVNLHDMMPSEDYSLFENAVNQLVLRYREMGKNFNVLDSLRIRLKGTNSSDLWFSLRGELTEEVDGSMILKGSGRRLDGANVMPVWDTATDRESILSAVLGFPDTRIFWIDKDFRVQGYNQLFLVGHGFPSDKDARGMALDQVVNEKYFAFFASILNRVIEDGRSVSSRGLFERENEKMDLVFNAAPLKDENGAICRILGMYMMLRPEDFTENIMIDNY